MVDVDSSAKGKGCLPVVAGIVGIIFFVAMGVWWWSEVRPVYAGCRHSQNLPGGGEYSAHSVHQEGRYTGESRQAVKKGSSSWVYALWLHQPKGKTLRIASYNDVSYVACTLDEERRRARFWLAEFRSPILWRAVIEGDPDFAPSRNGIRTLLRVADDSDAHVAERVRVTVDALRELSHRWNGFFTSWFPSKVLVEERIVGWLDGGVLLKGDQEGQLFWINVGSGIVGRFDEQGGCSPKDHVQPMCRHP